MSRSPFLALALVALAVACTPTEPAPDPGAQVATLDGVAIHEAELETWIRDELYAEATRGKGEAELFDLRSEALERLIDDRLLRAEVEKRGGDLESLQQEIVGGIEVSDEEVARFYEQNRQRAGDATFEQLGPRIRAFLTQQTRGQEWQRFVSGLRDAAAIEIAFEAPRFEVAATGPALGPEGAPVTIVEFSDFNCPFCQRVNATLKALLDRYPEQVRIVFRHYPLDSIHPRARAIAEASVCADEQDLFWDFHDRVFADGTALEDDALRAIAEGTGLDLDAYDACRADGRAGQVVARDVEDGAAVGVTGTPAFFVNGVRLTGAQPLDAFVDVIEKELADAS